MSNLIIMRHAKSDWSGNEPDFNRKLNKRGVLSCKIISENLKNKIIIPDLFIVSPALRATLTHKKIFSVYYKNNYLTKITIFEKKLYEGSLIEIIQSLDKKCKGYKNVVVIGHNPLLNNLIYSLSEKNHKKLPSNLVTCGTVIIKYPETIFNSNGFKNGEIVDYIFPKQFIESY